MTHGFYTQAVGVELPHPPISLPVFLVVENALSAAWKRMRTHPRSGFNLLNATEDVITQELYEVLYDEIFGKDVVEGFDRQLFTTVTRESKVRNYDGTHLDKMPDLLIGLVDRLNVFKPSQDWLFIECKPVDVDHSAGVHYCDKGIIRFVRGEYAWAMTSAMMIGYSKTGYAILPKLAEALKSRRTTIPTLAVPTPCLHSTAGSYSEAVHISQHSRTFRYVETGADAPPITIRHLWLKRN